MSNFKQNMGLDGTIEEDEDFPFIVEQDNFDVSLSSNAFQKLWRVPRIRKNRNKNLKEKKSRNLILKSKV